MPHRLAGLRPSELHPIYPAMVMGTGSLSTGAALLGFPSLSVALFALALLAFALLLVLTLLRIAHHRAAVRADARHPKTAFAPYTLVAALAVLANRATLAGLTVAPAAALGLGLLGAAALAVPVVRMVRAHASRPEAATGNWQLPSVAIEALALLAAALAKRLDAPALAAVAGVIWLVGIVAYVLVVPALIRRCWRAPLGPADFTPDFWTPMAVPSLIGLVAAQLFATGTALDSTVGAVLERAAFGGLAISAVLAPVWIVLHARRLVRDPSSRRYSPAWWGLVFPTAIVVVAAQVIGTTFDAPWLHTPALVGYACVFGAWIIIGLGLVRDVWRVEPVERSLGAHG
jgi:tellurite resistance protein TehA-like permease